MRLNLPITGQEKTFAAGLTLVSRTDTKGVITYANDNFVEVCGYSRQELVGAEHNIIRHPDVPAAVFAQMWDRLEHGYPWHGVVKNRCKNGDHYWVDAKVVPVRKHGQTIGYMSVRTCPTREDIARAEIAYQKAALAAAGGQARADAGWSKYFSIRNGVILGIVFVCLLMVAGGILGISGLGRSSDALRALYYEDMNPVQAIGRINFLMADNRAQVSLSLHHKPVTPGGTTLDHDLQSHLTTLVRNKLEIDTLWESYSKSIRSAAERELAEQYWAARNRYVQHGLMAAKAALERGDYAATEALLQSQVNPLYDAANAKVSVLLGHLSARAQANFLGVAERNRIISIVAVVGIVVGSLAMMLAGLFFFRATVAPLQTAVKALENIAEGNLSDTVDADALGEPGRVMAAVTVMQMHLKVMMDEIRQSSKSIHLQCSNLNQTMMNIAQQSDEQHDRVYQTLNSIQESCAGLSALAAEAEALMADVGGAAAPDGIGAQAREVATAARIQACAIEDAAAQLNQVAALIVQNNEDVQAAWAASQQLALTAQELDGLVRYFE